jgi:hypothetical protein
MGGSVHFGGRFGHSKESRIEERTTDRPPAAEEITAAVCKGGASVETAH